MKSITEYIDKQNIIELFEELNVENKDLYELKLETPEFNLYFHKHLLKRKSRHFEWNGQNYISDKKIIKLIEQTYKKIIDKYNSNKLKYSQDGKEAFVIIDKKSIDQLCIIGFICDLDKETAKYEICLKTVMYNDNFKFKNDKNFKTLPIIFESITNLIIVNNE